jgi:hypothetical protein
MPPKKTATAYGQEIRDDHLALQDILAQDHVDLHTLPLYHEMRDRIRPWAERLAIEVQVARNEQRPWTADEIVYITAHGPVTVTTKPMPTKALSGYNQVADYNFYIKDYDFFGGFAAERKTKDDIYQTLFSRDENRNWQRDRLYREISRFDSDPRFQDVRGGLAIFAECNLYDFLIHAPRFDPETKKYNHAHTDPVNPTQKRSAVAQLITGGTPIIWCGNRKAAATLYAHCIRAWCRGNYYQILGLEALPA